MKNLPSEVSVKVQAADGSLLEAESYATQLSNVECVNDRVDEAAKRDGSWSLLDEVERLELPPDLISALEQHDPAKETFEAFPRSVKRGILEWSLNVKRPETRAKRILETATLAVKNERANQWRGKSK